MIILSGVLVVVAIALLIAGIVAGNSGTEVVGLDGLNLIYISIGVSIVSALFLAIGVFLRRKDLFGPPTDSSSGPAARGDKRGKRDKDKAAKAGSESVPGQSADVGATPGQPIAERFLDADTAELAAALPPAVDVPADAVVYVVPGRRRYHIDSCRQLTGRDKEELTFEEAREEGFSPCTACMPDTALAARAVSGGPTAGKPRTAESTEHAAGELRETGLGAEPAPSADDRDGAFDAFGSNGSTASAASGAGPATEPFGQRDEDTPAGETSTPPGTPGAADDETDNPAGESAPDKDNPGNPAPAAEVPQQAPGPATAPDKAPGQGGHPTSADGPVVRILSGTKRYHRPDCALIEDIGDEADDLESLTRAEAKARGCTPCLVCQPDKEPATRD